MSILAFLGGTERYVSPKEEWERLILTSFKTGEGITYKDKETGEVYEPKRLHRLPPQRESCGGDDSWGYFSVSKLEIHIFGEEVAELIEDNDMYDVVLPNKEGEYINYRICKGTKKVREYISAFLDREEEGEKRHKEILKENKQKEQEAEDEKYRAKIKKALKIKPLDKDLKRSFDNASDILESGKIIKEETRKIERLRKETLTTIFT